ncbi:LPS translocon maturation chaperone LptM [Pseudidiomarina taiwanensis]|nr:lipoprotein [Pseudidiomarina taiwanensis]
MRIAVLIAALALFGCGQKGPLQPPAEPVEQQQPEDAPES